jgi:hypothetical protein
MPFAGRPRTAALAAAVLVSLSSALAVPVRAGADLNWFRKAMSDNSGPKAKQQALVQWGLLVCPKICRWDHKPTLRDMYGMDLGDLDSLYADVPGTGQRMFYDVWSNVHYAYVGREARFTGQELQDGARNPLAGQDRCR